LEELNEFIEPTEEKRGHISMLHRMENMQVFLKVCKFKDLGPFKVRPWRAAGNLKAHMIKVKP
jgi:hypothetical protein